MSTCLSPPLMEEHIPGQHGGGDVEGGLAWKTEALGPPESCFGHMEGFSVEDGLDLFI